MSEVQASVSRRAWLQAAAGLATASLVPGRTLHAAPSPEPFELSFFAVGDTHYLADKANPAQLDEQSSAVTRRLIDTLSKLPGSAIPESAGGGSVVKPRGLIHLGDLIDSGDKNGGPHPQMQRTEWKSYVEGYGLDGADGRLTMPVFDLHGNHDAPGGKGLIIDGLVERNRRRKGLAGLSENGLHYSWDWGPVHAVSLGIVVGDSDVTTRRRRYNPLHSFRFLVEDLEKNVGDTGRPVILCHHVDLARYTGGCDAAAPFTNKEWDPCDVHAFHDAIARYNIVAILYGHTHVRNVFRWDGASTRAARGIDVYNVDNSAHFHSDEQSFFYFHLTAERLTVREYHTENRWETAAWTPQVWRKPITLGSAAVKAG